MPEADAIIVGAGPAGASLAARLGDRGRRVLLLDRARFPRDAVCGEAISPGALALLAELEVDAPIRAAGAHPYRGVRLVAADGRVSEARYPGGAEGLSLPRLALDELLVARARRAPGVTLEQGALVTDVLREGAACAGVRLDDGRELRARVVVAADGRRSRVRVRWFGEPPPPPARRFCFLAALEGGEHEDDLLECGLAGPGLQYVRVCQGPGRFALCLVVDDATRETRRAGTPEGFRALVRELPALAPLAALRVGPLRGMPLSPYGPPRLVADGLLVLGDAAGYMDPITGEGMCRAFHGAAIAARVIDQALDGDGARLPAEALAAYERALREQFDPVVRFVELAVRVTTLPTPLTRLFVRAMSAMPRAACALAAAQGALLPPADLLRPTRWPEVAAS